MKWEKQEDTEDGEFWIVGDKRSDDVWTFMSDVVIDRLGGRSHLEFEVFGLPRHVFEDSGWKNPKDAINSMKSWIEELERVDTAAEKLNVEIFSDEFVGFRTSCDLETTDKKEIEERILKLRKAFGL